MTDEQMLIELLWGAIPLGEEDVVLALMRDAGLYDVWERALNAATDGVR